MSKYLTAKIYMLYSGSTERVYIGSTRKTLALRFSNHKTWHNRAVAGLANACTASQILQFGDAQIELLEACSCETADEMRARERFWIESTPECVNKNIPGRTAKEWRATYYAENRELINANGARWRRENSERVAEYYDANREKINERSLRHYHEKVAGVRVICEACNLDISKTNYRRHCQSAHHRRNMGIPAH